MAMFMALITPAMSITTQGLRLMFGLDRRKLSDQAIVMAIPCVTSQSPNRHLSMHMTDKTSHCASQIQESKYLERYEHGRTIQAIRDASSG